MVENIGNYLGHEAKKHLASCAGVTVDEHHNQRATLGELYYYYYCSPQWALEALALGQQLGTVLDSCSLSFFHQILRDGENNIKKEKITRNHSLCKFTLYVYGPKLTTSSFFSFLLLFLLAASAVFLAPLLPPALICILSLLSDSPFFFWALGVMGA